MMIQLHTSVVQIQRTMLKLVVHVFVKVVYETSSTVSPTNTKAGTDNDTSFDA